jgi:hypothetical protein
MFDDNIESFKEFLSRNAQFRNNATLVLAIKYRSFKIFKYLYQELSSYCHRIRMESRYIFKLACKSGCLEIVKFVGDEVDIKNEIKLLRSCVKRKHFDIIKYLIENGCDPDKTCGMRLYPIALTRCPLNILIYLAESGYDMLSEDISLLHLSAAWGDFDFVKYLFEVGYDVPLHAMFTVDAKTAEYLFYRVPNRHKIAYITDRIAHGRSVLDTHKNITSFRKTHYNLHQKNYILKLVLKPTSLFIQSVYF